MEKTTEKKPRNGFLPWIISMEMDEHADGTSVSCHFSSSSPAASFFSVTFAPV